MKCPKRKLLFGLGLAGPGDRCDRLVVSSCPIGPRTGRFPGIRGEFRRKRGMDYEDDGRPAPRMPLWLRGLWGDWPYAHVVKVKSLGSRPVARCR